MQSGSTVRNKHLLDEHQLASLLFGLPATAQIATNNRVKSPANASQAAVLDPSHLPTKRMYKRKGLQLPH